MLQNLVRYSCSVQELPLTSMVLLLGCQTSPRQTQSLLSQGQPLLGPPSYLQ